MTFFFCNLCDVLSSFLSISSKGGGIYSQDGGEDVTSRQHDRGGGHGPPGTPVWRLLPGEPEEPLRSQWDLRESPQVFPVCLSDWLRVERLSETLALQGFCSWLFNWDTHHHLFSQLHRRCIPQLLSALTKAVTITSLSVNHFTNLWAFLNLEWPLGKGGGGEEEVCQNDGAKWFFFVAAGLLLQRWFQPCSGFSWLTGLRPQKGWCHLKSNNWL